MSCACESNVDADFNNVLFFFLAHQVFELPSFFYLDNKNNRKICSKMITSIIRYHTAIYYIMSITRDRFRPYWVSSGGCKKHSIINMLKKQICHWVQKKKNAIQNNMIQQYLYHGGHIQGHTHMTWTTSHIGKP